MQPCWEVWSWPGVAAYETPFPPPRQTALLSACRTSSRPTSLVFFPPFFVLLSHNAERSCGPSSQQRQAIVHRPSHRHPQNPTCTPRPAPRTTAIIMFHLFLQLCLAALAVAAPLAGGGDETMTTSSANWQYGTGGGIIGFIVLVLDIIVWSTSVPRPPSSLLRFPLALAFPTCPPIPSSRRQHPHFDDANHHAP